jgi:NAD(P) transhydrogenase
MATPAPSRSNVPAPGAPFDLVCLGCGPAAEKAATQAAYYGRRVAVVEKAPRPGGAMVNTGTIPSKVLRETALLGSAFRRRPIPGVDFAVDHRLSVPRFMAQRHFITEQEHDRIESSLDRHGVEVIHGHGRVVAPNAVEVRHDDGTRTRLQAHNILVATGSSPVRPKNVPFDHPRVCDADQVLDLEQLPSSMIIVGAGVIGCEYASIFAEIQVAVTIVHPQEELLPFIDATCRDHLVRAMEDAGVEFRLGERVERVDAGDRSVCVQYASGGHDVAEVLLWTAGRAPNTREIGLEDVGVALTERGHVRVDERYRTSVPSIWAAGDVIGFPALAATSIEQGRIAACHMFGLDFKTKLAQTIPMGIYTIPGVSAVGLSEEGAAAKGHDVVTGAALYRDNARGRMLGDCEGILKCVFDRRTRRLLGACIVGEDATELIHLAQWLIVSGGGIDDLIDACFNYPSLAELYKYAAYSALQAMARQSEGGSVAA